MSILNQKTIKNPVRFAGVGLHTGQKVSMTIKPSEPNSGILFKRTDIEKQRLKTSKINLIIAYGG